MPDDDSKAESRAQEQARYKYESIVEMMQRRDAAKTEKEEDDSLEEIEQFPLSVMLRGDWHEPYTDKKVDDVEYQILLCTGGPAVRIIGDLGEDGPCTAVLECQDWFEQWTQCNSEYNEDVLIEFASRLLPC